MSRLQFAVVDAEPDRSALTPTLRLRLRVTDTEGKRIHALALRCQLRIEPKQRRYADAEKEALRDLFGAPQDWGTNAKPFLWRHEATMVPGFTGETEFDLPVTCTYDFEVIATKYLQALSGGEVPVALLFNGTVFEAGEQGFSATPLGWDTECSWRLPVALWRQTMDLFFPGAAWIRVHQDTLAALQRYRSQRGLPTWEQTFAELLAAAGVSEAART